MKQSASTEQQLKSVRDAYEKVLSTVKIDGEEPADDVKRIVMATVKIDGDRDNLGKALVYAFWQLEKDRAYVNAGFDTLVDLIEESASLYKDPDYVKGLAKGVGTIMRAVYDAEKKGKPYKDSKGNPFTVDAILAAGGMPAKLKANGEYFSSILGDKEKTNEFMEAVASGSAATVGEVKRRQKRGAIGDDVGGKVYALKSRRQDGGYRLVLDRMNEDQLEVIMRQIASMLDLHVAESDMETIHVEPSIEEEVEEVLI